MKQKTQALSCEVLSDFCRQLSMLLKAGISLSQGLDLLLEDSETEAERALMTKLSQGFMETGMLAPAMEQTGRYPAYLLRMVRLGEETGRLDDVMASLADHYDREHSLRRSIRGAVAYPALMLGMMLIIVCVLLTQVMPIFDQVFAQLGTRLTGLSRLLMDLGQGIREYSLVLTVIVLILAAAVLWVRSKPRLASRMIRWIPWSRNLSEKITLCRFSGALSLTLGSGLSTQYAMELAQELVEDADFGRRVALTREKLDEGQDLTQALHEAGILTGTHNRLAVIGQKTGTVDQALSRIADICRDEADRAMTSAIALIEPILVVVLSLMVGVLLMSVLFPLLGILASI